jgi:hypothetical protein
MFMHTGQEVIQYLTSIHTEKYDLLPGLLSHAFTFESSKFNSSEASFHNWT